MKSSTLAALLAFAALQASAVQAIAAPIVVTPTSDGSLYTCDGCNVVSDGDYLLASGYIQGDVKFASARLPAASSQVLLALNPYGEPLWGQDVAVYGFTSTIGALDASDANAGTYLGTLVLPANLGYGQDAFFDVTAFVDGVHAPYVGFNLRTTGTDVFSSLEYNLGHPAELIATAAAVPEPANAALLLAGALMAAAGMVRRRAR